MAMKEVLVATSPTITEGNFKIIQADERQIQNGHVVGKMVYSGELEEIADKFAAMGIVGFYEDKDGRTVLLMNVRDYLKNENRFVNGKMWQ